MSGRISIGVKRKPCSETTKMGEEPKRANFSALSNPGPNGSLKPGPSPSGPAGVRKIVIKSIKELPKLPDNYQVDYP